MAQRLLSVVHVTEPVDGGVARHVLDLVADQVQRGWSVHVVSPTEPAFVAALGERGARHAAWALPVRLASGRGTDVHGTRLLRTLRPLRASILAARPDVVHLHSSHAGLAGRLALRGRVPTVFEPNGWSFLAVTDPRAGLARRWERLAARWTAVTVCVSADECRLALAAGVEGRLEVVPNAVDTAALTPPADEERAAARARLAPGGGPLAVCVGALRRQKGQDVLLAAWPAVQERVPGARLVLVGDGPDREALERAAPGGVVFAGHRTDVPDWLAAADVLVFPSRWEGMSFALLEAMASGSSIVATDAPGVREALGDAGAVVPPAEVAPLAEAVAARLLDAAVRARERRAARERAEQGHELRDSLDALAGIYGELAY